MLLLTEWISWYEYNSGQICLFKWTYILLIPLTYILQWSAQRKQVFITDLVVWIQLMPTLAKRWFYKLCNSDKKT